MTYQPTADVKIAYQNRDKCTSGQLEVQSGYHEAKICGNP